MMRTTVTLDDDIAARLDREMRRSGKSFKETLNEALRQGLAHRRQAASAERFVVQARRLGTIPGLDYSNIGDLLEVAEGPDHR